jgi:signal transduction histidine kinase
VRSLPRERTERPGAELARSNRRRLEASVRARDEFLARLIHRLRNPLSPLYLQIRALRAQVDQPGGCPEGLPGKIAALSDSADAYLRSLDRLADLCSMQSGDLDLAPESMDLAPVVRRVVSLLDGQIRAAGVDLRLDLHPAPGFWDRRRLEDVCFQLLSNAIRFGAGGAVEISLVSGRREACLTVRDHGVGIPEGEHETIFAGPDRHGAEPSGLGIGLWTTRHVVEAMGGSVTVESVTGQGATFTVRLPRRDE